MISERNIYVGRFDYKNPDGTDGSIQIKPLPVKHLPKMFKVARKLQGIKEGDTQSVMDKMDEEVVKDMTELCLATMEVSCPELSPELRDSFVANHFVNLVGVVFNTNIRN